jgi:catechol 2,3-dioxygenase-like lactoylglutathione lyase family enzyme
MAVSFQVTYDCADPAAQGAFWAEVLGYREQLPPEGYADWLTFLRDQGVPENDWNSAFAIVDPDGRGPRLFFQKVPEAKSAKNRVHLDVNVGAGLPAEDRRSRVDSEVERVVRLGASRVRTCDQSGEYWVVMQDPEGNEFCLQ